MVIKEIQEYGEIRTKARAYLCYLLKQNLPSRLPNIALEDILSALKKTSEEIQVFDAIYILDPSGRQITNTVSVNPHDARKGMGENRNGRAYYYRVIKENRCVLTDPYPSLSSNNLVVTASYPIYNERDEMIYIVCLDISLENILRLVHPTSIDSIFGKVSKYVYAAFSFALAAVAMLLFVQGISHFLKHGLYFTEISIKDMFESTILLTLSLAIFDLVKAIFEEEVLGSRKKNDSDEIHKTMVRFMGSIIIALSIEALMLVFKFAITDPSKLLYAVYLIGGITALIIGLSVYLRAINSSSDKQDGR